MWQDISLFRAQSFLFQLKISKTEKQPATTDSLRTSNAAINSISSLCEQEDRMKTLTFSTVLVFLSFVHTAFQTLGESIFSYPLQKWMWKWASLLSCWFLRIFKIFTKLYYSAFHICPNGSGTQKFTQERYREVDLLLKRGEYPKWGKAENQKSWLTQYVNKD